MTDDLEQGLARMLRDRVAEMPSSHEVRPATVARVHRRRAVKFGAFATAVVVVVAGTAAAVAQAAHNGADHVSTAEPTTVPQAGSIVPTVACPVTYAVTPGQSLPTPSTAPRHTSVPGADRLWSYAATTDDRYIVLGPKGWTCSTQIGADGNASMVLFPPGQARPAPFADTASLSVDNDWLWHGLVGVGEACAVFTDRVLVNQANGKAPCALPAGRTVTRVDPHTATFRDADGGRGAARVDYPSSPSVDDGKLSILTCRPTDGLSADECDTIVADFVARLRDGPVTAAPAVLPSAPDAISGWVATASGVAIADLHDAGIAVYDAASNTWRSFEGPPFAGDRSLFAARGNNVYVIGTVRSMSDSAPFAALDATTGLWRRLASVPAGVPDYLQATGDETHLFGVGAFEAGVYDNPGPTVAAEYDIAANRWMKLPASPLGPRGASVVQWTGKQLLVWSGGSNHQGCVPSYTDGAAYDPATRAWRTMPQSPLGGRGWAASVWTGRELLVWGGSDGVCGRNSLHGDGAAFDPAANSWRVLPDAALRPVRYPVAAWTGREMVLIAGGQIGTVAVAAYDPTSNTWRPLLPPTPAVHEGNGALAAFVGGRAIVGVTADGVLTAFGYEVGG